MKREKMCNKNAKYVNIWTRVMTYYVEQHLSRRLCLPVARYTHDYMRAVTIVPFVTHNGMYVCERITTVCTVCVTSFEYFVLNDFDVTL